MSDQLDLDNRFFAYTFLYHLNRLEAKGFVRECNFPVDPNQSDSLVVITYTGSFEIRITRDFRCQVEMVCLPPKGSGEDHRRKTHLSPIIFLLSSNKVYLGSLLNDIGCWYQNYEKNISQICIEFFNYYDEVERMMCSENISDLYSAIEKNRVPFLKTAGYYPDWYQEDPPG
ncbi:MAG: hypothetical protein RBS09_01380 [Anaerolineaceae bacterium]|jgi:hypothetical protein|nr:hypothetical protein [Anaerolineaceae bacterium]